MTSKVLFYIRIFRDFGIIVLFMSSVIQTVIPFSIFLCFLCGIFAQAYDILGAHFEEESAYSDDISMFKDFKISWDMSSGGGYIPIIKQDDHGKLEFQVMETSVWILWFFQNYMMVMILMNFLIALIT